MQARFIAQAQAVLCMHYLMVYFMSAADFGHSPSNRRHPHAM